MSDGAIYLPCTVYHVPCIMDLPVLFVCSYLLSSVLTMYPVACCHRPVVPFYPVSRRRQVYFTIVFMRRRAI